MKMAEDITALLEIMAILRDPKTGCAWDLKQDFASIIPYTIEEAYEVADAIRRRDWPDLCEELGDLLLQTVYHARMAEEQGYFTFQDVARAIVQKMRRRHPHIFGDEEERVRGAEPDQWQKIKREEKQQRRLERGRSESSLLDGISPALPSIIEAMNLSKKAATIGFDWPESSAIFEKMAEELTELKQAITEQSQEKIAAEYGDVLFTLINLGRKLKLDPQSALGLTNLKFRNRFAFIEKALRQQGKTLEDASLDEMEALWNQAKEQEHS